MKALLKIVFYILLMPQFLWALTPALVAPVLIDRQFTESIWISPKSAEKTELLKSDLLRILKPLVKMEVFENLQKIADTQGKITFGQLRSFHIHPSFDAENLQVIIELDPMLRPGNEADLSSDANDPQFTPILPALFSGSLTLRGTEDFQYGNNSTITHPRQFIGVAELVQSFNNVVFETGVDYFDTNSEEKHHRLNTKISTELFNKSTWFELGDTAPTAIGLQSTFEMGGLSLTRSKRVNTFRLFRATKDQEIFLKRLSIVEVYISDFLFSRAQAQPGPFTLKNIPLGGGFNKIKIKITDDVGQVEEIDASTLLDSEMLRPEEWNYNFSIGYASVADGSDRKYLKDSDSYSLFLNRGFTHYYELGINAQGKGDNHLFGLEASKLLPFGLTILDVAARTSTLQSTAYGAQLKLTSRNYEYSERPTNWFITGQYKDYYFSSIVNDPVAQMYRKSIDLGVSQGFGESLLGSFNTRSEFPEYSTDPIRNSYFVSLSKNLFKDLKAEINYQQTVGNDLNYTANFNLTWQENAQRTYSASYLDPTSEKRLSFNYEPTSRVGSAQANASLFDAKETSRQNFLLDYTADRAVLGLDHNSSTTKADSSSIHSTKIKLASALYWADGHATIGRPTSDSFVLVTSSKDLHGFNIPINDPRLDTYSEVRQSSPALVPQLASFAKQILVAEATSLPQGYSLKNSSFYFEPFYRSGTHLHLVGHGSVMVIGYLQNKYTKDPVSLVGGEVIRTDVKGSSSVPFFTNSKGRFVIEGLEGGSYEIHIHNSELHTISFEIPKDLKGVYQLPTPLFTFY